MYGYFAALALGFIMPSATFSSDDGMHVKGTTTEACPVCCKKWSTEIFQERQSLVLGPQQIRKLPISSMLGNALNNVVDLTCYSNVHPYTGKGVGRDD